MRRLQLSLQNFPHNPTRRGWRTFASFVLTLGLLNLSCEALSARSNIRACQKRCFPFLHISRPADSVAPAFPVYLS
jgi:hypothetical protein